MKVIQSINRSKLSAADQLNYELFKKKQGDAIEGTRFEGEYMPITQLGGPQQSIAEILDQAPHSTVKDYEDILSRLGRIPNFLDQNMVLLNKGLEIGVTPPRITLREVPQQIRNQMTEEPEKNALLRPFYDFPPEIATEQRERLRGEATRVFKEKVSPAFGKSHEFFVTKYLPRTRETIAMSDLPDGKAW